MLVLLYALFSFQNQIFFFFYLFLIYLFFSKKMVKDKLQIPTRYHISKFYANVHNSAISRGCWIFLDQNCGINSQKGAHFFPRGGTQIWVGQGCAARASKPVPIFKGDFGRKGYPFLRVFSWKIDSFFKNFTIFWVFTIRKHKNLGSVRKGDPCLRIFFVKNRTHV